jgi:hypothetical protein
LSERRTAEIKIRLTPAEKGWWQAMADEESTTVSELIRREMNERARVNRQWAEHNQSLDGTALVDNAIKHLTPEANEALHAGRPQHWLVLEAPGHDSVPEHVSGRDCACSPCPQCGHVTTIEEDPSEIPAPGHDSPLDGMSEACIQAASCMSTPCQCNAAPQEVVGTTDEVGAKGDRCAHGIAPWQFCGLCR